MTDVPNHNSRNQAYLLFAFTVSTAGDWLYRLALPLLVLDLTGSAVSAALAYALEFLPYLFFSLVGGVAADRVNRLRLLISTDLLSALIVAGLAGLLMAGRDQVWLVFLVAFILSSMRPVYHPAFQSLLPSITRAEALPSVNSRIQAIDSLFMFAGPVLGVGVVATLGTTNALWLDALSFVLSALALWRIRSDAVSATRTQPPMARRRIRDDLTEAGRYLRKDRIILTGSLIMMGSAAGIMMIEANLIFYIVILLAKPVAVVGAVLGANGVGAVLGALVAPRLLRRFPPGRLIAAALVGTGTFTALLALTSNVTAIAVAWGLVGGCVTVIVVAWFTLRQRIVPGHLLGRVVAASRAMAFAASPIGAVFGAWLLSQNGVVPTVVASAGLQIVVGLAAFGTALGSARFPLVVETAGAATPQPGVAPNEEAQAQARSAAS